MIRSDISSTPMKFMPQGAEERTARQPDQLDRIPAATDREDITRRQFADALAVGRHELFGQREERPVGQVVPVHQEEVGVARGRVVQVELCTR